MFKFKKEVLLNKSKKKQFSTTNGKWTEELYYVNLNCQYGPLSVIKIKR